MPRISFLLTFTAAACLSPLALAADPAKEQSRVTVRYEQPENFTDMARSDGAARGADEGYLAQLREHFEQAAKHRLPTGTRLEVTVTDVDMAGRFEPERGPQFSDVRVVRDIYPPRIRLEYRLLNADGSVVSEGERTLTDLAFANTVMPVSHQDPLRYEKRLVDDFFRELRRESK